MDNSEGSRVITSTFRARKNLVLHVTDQQMSIILGSILGDAYIHPQGKICFEQAESHKDYLYWKYAQLKNIAYPKVALVTRLDKRTNQQTRSYRFFLRQYFRPLRKVFYNNRKKVVPSSLQRWMTPLLLSVWYMDDGYLDRSYPQLMTECFSISDIDFLRKSLKDKFNIESIRTSKKRIQIKSNSTSKFFHLVEPFMHETLGYKLP